MTDTEALSDPWFIPDDEMEIDLHIPSLKPRLAPAMVMIAFVVLAPLAYAAFAML